MEPLTKKQMQPLDAGRGKGQNLLGAFRKSAGLLTPSLSLAKLWWKKKICFSVVLGHEGCGNWLYSHRKLTHHGSRNESKGRLQSNSSQMGSVLQHRKIDWMLMNLYLGRNRVYELNEYIRKEEKPQVNLNFFLKNLEEQLKPQINRIKGIID